MDSEENKERRNRYSAPPRLPEGETVTVDSFLPGSGPLEIEIGPGRGAFVYERCAARPDIRLLAFEIRRKWACIVDEQLHEMGLSSRARVLAEDALEALPRLKPDASVSRFFVHFPDPWWKRRHEKRLVVVDPLIADVARLLKDGAEILVQTDVPERAAQYQERLDSCPLLEAAGDEEGSPVLAANPYQARSNREQRADEDGLPVYRLHYRRKARS